MALDLIRAIQDRSAAYLWPPAAPAFAKGRQPRITRKGLRIFYLFRREFRSSIDPRALETELANRRVVFASDKRGEGLTIQQFAEWAGVDRGRVGRHIVEVPSGPAPSLPPGKIPARRFGNTRRIFKQDVLGMPADRGGIDANRTQSEASVSASEPAWAGPLCDLFDA